jgi:hypothetical protein
VTLKRYGEKAHEEGTARADELAAQDDHNAAAVSRRITDAAGQLANETPPVRCTDHLKSHSAAVSTVANSSVSRIALAPGFHS